MENSSHQLKDKLESKLHHCSEYVALLGFDGAIDKLYSTVNKRFGTGDQFNAFPTIDSFGRRISAAAGKSTAVELFPKIEKIGGNGPIMSGALAAGGPSVHYIGPLGMPNINPAFEDFSEKVVVHSIGKPAVTHALEFQDGKVMLPVVSPYDDISGSSILEVLGKETLEKLVSKSDLIALLNWTWLPQMPDIYDLFLEAILPCLSS